MLLLISRINNVLSFWRVERTTLNPEGPLFFLEGDETGVRLKLFLGTGQFGRVDPPKGFNVLEYLVIRVR